MDLPEMALFAVVVGIVLAGLLLAARPLLARLAARNIRRRTTRVVIVILGLLVGTAVISSSLVVGDTLSYIFLEDVYVRLGAIDEIVSNEFNGQLISFSEANATQVAADLAAWRTPIDGLAPTLLKVMPVRNVAGNKGNQQITVMGLDASREAAFGPLTARDGSVLTTDSLNASAVYANERAAADLNATVGQQLTLFYGTTNQTLVHATVADIVRDEGTAAYEHRSLLFMDLRRAQAAFNESGAINQIRISNIGGVADGLGVADNVTTNLRLSIAIHHLDLRVHSAPSSVLTAFVAGTALTWATILGASWRVSRLNIVRAIRDLPEPGTRERSRDAFAAGLLAAAAGLALTAWGFAANTGLGKIPGPPLLSLGLGIAVASRGHARAALTIASAFNLVWILVPVGLLNQQTDNVSIAFVMTGIILVGSAILIAVFNVSEALRSLLRRANRGAGRPVLSTAVSYPAEKRFRTGMTVAMFALILFMVTLISMVQGLQASSLDTFVRQQSGGYDVIAYTTSYGEIPNFRQMLQQNFSDRLFLGGWSGVSSASVLAVKGQSGSGNRSYDYTLWGVDNFLLRSNGYGFTRFLSSYVNDSTGLREDLTTRESVWLSLRYNHTLAIVDRSAAGPNEFVPDESRLRVIPGDSIRAFDAAGRVVNLTVVGVLEQALQFTSGVFVDPDVVRAVFPAQERYTAYFFQMDPTADVGAFRADLERVFFPYGLQTIDIREEIGRAFDASQQVLTLMEAYLGIGLLVGIAGLAVITLRAVVERRTQIGALRAIGFTRRMVLFVFLLEIALIAVLGVGIGVGLGIVFAYKIWAVYFADIIVFRIPWDHLLLIVGIASVAAVASTAQPALRASRIPPAEALRYIE